MTREQALTILSGCKDELKRYGVATLSVFGSVARDEAADASDVDLLVEFDRPVGLFEFVRLRRFLCGRLGCDVDLVTPPALKEQLRQRILEEAIRAA